MRILTYLLSAKMNLRLFLVWLFGFCSAAFLIGILFQLYRAAKAFADGLPLILSSLSRFGV